MTDLKDSEVFIKFSNEDGVDLFVPLSDIFHVGVPIDENGDDLPRADDLVYRIAHNEYVAIRA